MYTKNSFEKNFETDVMSKRERVERTLNHQQVDRVALHEQLSYNPGVISLYTGKIIEGFNYSIDDVCSVIQKKWILAFRPGHLKGLLV